MFNEIGKKIIENAARRLARGYVPPIIVMGIVESKKITDMVAFEQAADVANIQPHSRILYEIDCANQKMRELSIYFNIAGKEGFKDRPRDWQYVSPETNGARLLKIVCQTR